MIEKTILSNLVLNNEYCRAVLPFIKEEYFVDSNNKIIFGIVKNFINKYNNQPNKVSLALEAEKLSINEDQHKAVVAAIDGMQDDPKIDRQWLIEIGRAHV